MDAYEHALVARLAEHHPAPVVDETGDLGRPVDLGAALEVDHVAHAGEDGELAGRQGVGDRHVVALADLMTDRAFRDDTFVVFRAMLEDPRAWGELAHYAAEALWESRIGRPVQSPVTAEVTDTIVEARISLGGGARSLAVDTGRFYTTDDLIACKPDALLHHSDRGSQYGSGDYQRVLAHHGLVCSMSRRGNCYDCEDDRSAVRPGLTPATNDFVSLR